MRGDDYMGSLDEIDKETQKSWNPAGYLLTRCSDGNDRTLPPRVWSTPERSKTSGAMTGRSQSPVQPVSIIFARPDAGTPSDRTLNSRVRSLLRSNGSPPVN